MGALKILNHWEIQQIRLFKPIQPIRLFADSPDFFKSQF